MKGKIILLLFVFLITGTSCAEMTGSEISSGQTIVKTETSAGTVMTTESIKTTAIKTTESAELTERQIVEKVCNAIYGDYCDKSLIDDTIKHLTDNVERLSEKVSGEITSGEDAIEKARAVLIELGLSDWIERTESEFVTINGEKVKYQRKNEPYSVNFYDEYDACYIVPNPPSGVTDNGRNIASPAMPPYVILRKSDGKVLGVFV
ncbi:MAG: hypothetical protein K2J37_02760 [Ruminococcus sp.]|nr:hypothetical protein [Ruminococcus sp.]MDE6783761.1 hypothetical protein [Ruminococcus sp.]